jgi:hypothetical protein
MNEQIKELARQAGITIPADTEFNGHIHRNALEKFAKLLEQEFFSAGYLAGKSDGTMETIQECANFLADSLDDHFASEQLREHFGVE